MKRRLTIGLAASIGAVAVASAEATAAEAEVSGVTIRPRGVRSPPRPGVHMNSEPPIM